MTRTTQLYANVHAFPVPHARPRTIHLDRLDGTPWANAGFLPGLASAPWTWIQQTVAHELSCSEDDVGCMETEDGDVVTVSGLPVYRLRI